MALLSFLLVLSAAAAEPPEITRSAVRVEQVRVQGGPPDASLDTMRSKMEAALRAQAERVAARGGARDLLGAALVWPMAGTSPWSGETAPAQAWFAAAKAATPPEPLTDWIEATGCFGLVDPCDADAAIARLVASDGDNAAVHVLAMHAAARAGHDDAVAFHLRQGATSHRFEPMEPALQALLLEAHAGIDLPDADAALDAHREALFGSAEGVSDEAGATLLAMARALSFSSPSHFAITKACRDATAATDPARHADCMALLTLMADDEAASHRLFALGELSRLTAGQARGDAWREALRQALWVLERAGTLAEPGKLDAAGLLRFAEAMHERGQVSAMEELLRMKGIPVEPAPDWLPASERSRALVTTGVVID